MKTWIFVSVLCTVTCTLRRGQPTLTCDFEQNLCDWRADSSSSYIMWKRRWGQSRTEYSGPSGDHTSGNGFYMVMQTHRYASAILSLRSPRITSVNETCLTFWYQMHGFDIGGLVVNRRDSRHNEHELFRVFGPQGNRWYQAHINTGSGVKFKLNIQASYYDGHMGLGDIAIDDISFSYNGSCQTSAIEKARNEPRFDCDFEDDFCSWYAQGSRWQRVSVSSDTTDRNALPPNKERTTYVQLDNTKRGMHTYTHLRGPTVSIESKGACLSFWYKMNDSMTSMFAVNKYDYGKGLHARPDQLFVVHSVQGEYWTHQNVIVPHGYNMYIAFSASFQSSYDGIVAIDDVRLSQDGPCPEVLPESYINCDFEKDFCGWYLKSSKNDGDWVRRKGPTSTNNTGPSHDHTYEDKAKIKNKQECPSCFLKTFGTPLKKWAQTAGHYIYLDGSKVNIAKLYSPTLNVDSHGACLSFWYYMYGEDVDKLEVALHKNRLNFADRVHQYSRPLKNSRLESEELLWSLQGSQENKWIQQNISIPETNYFHVVFTATRGYFPRSDIAIDDITISFGGICKTEHAQISLRSTAITKVQLGTALFNVSFPPWITTVTPILQAPTLTIMGEVNPAYEDSTVAIICGDISTGLRYSWFKKNAELFHTIEGEDDQFLMFDEIQLTDAGTYKCMVEQDGFISAVSNTVDVKIVPDPRPVPLLTADSQIDPALMDSAIKLTCGNEVKRGVYHWKTDSPALHASTLPTDHVLLLNITSLLFNGNYSCRISKDGHFTAKSKTIKINVVAGKYCDDVYQCFGEGFIPNCIDHRCECDVNTVPMGQTCRMRPHPPVISTWPNFREFNLGESFYLACDFIGFTPASLTYSFLRYNKELRRDKEHEAYKIFKIANSTIEDSGDYRCCVSHDNVESHTSQIITVVIKEFLNLNCDFSDGLCNWLMGNIPNSVNFTFEKNAESVSHSETGSYIQLHNAGDDHTHRAMLRTPILNQVSSDSCLTFWYRLHGSNVYSLTVWKYSFSTQWKEDVGDNLWTIVGDQGHDWIPQNVTIPRGVNFYILFEAIGDVSIDDIILSYRGGC